MGIPAKMNKMLAIGCVTWFDCVVKVRCVYPETRFSTMLRTPVECTNALERNLTVARFTLPIIDSR